MSVLVSDLEDEGMMERAGIKCGDLIIALDGEEVYGLASKPNISNKKLLPFKKVVENKLNSRLSCTLSSSHLKPSLQVADWSVEETLGLLETLSSVTLTLLPNKQQQTKYLMFLDLSPGDMTHLWALNNLTCLHICGVKLRNGLVDLRGVTCRHVVRDLTLTKADITSLTRIQGLGKLGNLKSLNLNHNKLCGLDEGVMSGLTLLEELTVGNNNIDRFPTVLIDMPHLRDLSLVYNLISTIPHEITGMRALENLHLDNNYLSEMPDYVTHQLPSLRSLTFSNNQLSWPEQKIRECFHLSSIDFSENGVRARTGLDNFGVVGRATLRRKGKKKEGSLLRQALNASTV